MWKHEMGSIWIRRLRIRGLELLELVKFSHHEHPNCGTRHSTFLINQKQNLCIFLYYIFVPFRARWMVILLYLRLELEVMAIGNENQPQQSEGKVWNLFKLPFRHSTSTPHNHNQVSTSNSVSSFAKSLLPSPRRLKLDPSNKLYFPCMLPSSSNSSFIQSSIFHCTTLHLLGYDYIWSNFICGFYLFRFMLENNSEYRFDFGSILTCLIHIEKVLRIDYEFRIDFRLK